MFLSKPLDPLYILFLGVFLGLVLLHYLLFREYLQQEKLQEKRLKDLEYLVYKEIERSLELGLGNIALKELRQKTLEKLTLIRLQLEALKKSEGKNRGL